MLVLGVFPFGADALFEEVVVGFEGQFGGGGYVVLMIKERDQRGGFGYGD